jgi:hypothetical protein
MAERRYYCISTMLSVGDITDLYYVKDHHVWGSKSELETFINANGKVREEKLAKARKIANINPVKLYKLNIEVLEKKDKYACVTPVIRDPGDVSRMKYVTKYRLFGLKDDVLRVVKEIKESSNSSSEPANGNSRANSGQVQSKSRVNIHSDAGVIVFNTLPFLSEADLEKSAQVSSIWANRVNQIINERVNSLKNDIFRYQKLMFNNYYLTMRRLYRLGYIDYTFYMFPACVTPNNIEFTTRVMLCALKYDPGFGPKIDFFINALAILIVKLRTTGRNDFAKKLKDLAMPILEHRAKEFDMSVLMYGDYDIDARKLSPFMIDKRIYDNVKTYPQLKSLPETTNDVFLDLHNPIFMTLPKEKSLLKYYDSLGVVSFKKTVDGIEQELDYISSIIPDKLEGTAMVICEIITILPAIADKRARIRLSKLVRQVFKEINSKLARSKMHEVMLIFTPVEIVTFTFLNGDMTKPGSEFDIGNIKDIIKQFNELLGKSSLTFMGRSDPLTLYITSRFPAHGNVNKLTWKISEALPEDELFDKTIRSNINNAFDSYIYRYHPHYACHTVDVLRDFDHESFPEDMKDTATTFQSILYYLRSHPNNSKSQQIKLVIRLYELTLERVKASDIYVDSIYYLILKHLEDDTLESYAISNYIDQKDRAVLWTRPGTYRMEQTITRLKKKYK